MRNDLSAELVRSCLDYDRDTGIFVWKSCLNRPGRARGIAGSINGAGYVHIGISNKLYLAHRLAWLHVHGRWPAQFLDHVNGDRSDNRLVNLREAIRAENNQNRRISSNNKSGFKGVHVRSDGKIQAAIGVRRKQHFLGYFPSLKAASEAYERAAKDQFGSFARLDAKVTAAKEILRGAQ